MFRRLVVLFGHAYALALALLLAAPALAAAEHFLLCTPQTLENYELPGLIHTPWPGAPHSAVQVNLASFGMIAPDNEPLVYDFDLERFLLWHEVRLNRHLVMDMHITGPNLEDSTLEEALEDYGWIVFNTLARQVVAAGDYRPLDHDSGSMDDESGAGGCAAVVCASGEGRDATLVLLLALALVLACVRRKFPAATGVCPLQAALSTPPPCRF